MPTLYIFVGFPGAGKTTISRWICEETGAVHIWADRERKEMFKRPTHDAKESKELYKHLNARVQKLLIAGKSVVFDTNFNFLSDREYMRNIATNAGAETRIVWVKTAKPLAKNRATSETTDKPTRILGSMSPRTFDRIAGHLQPPTNEDGVIILDGVDLEKTDTLVQLGLM